MLTMEEFHAQLLAVTAEKGSDPLLTALAKLTQAEPQALTTLESALDWGQWASLSPSQPATEA